MKKLILSLAVGAGLSASALAVPSVSDEMTNAVGSDATDVSLTSNGVEGNPPEGDPPEGEPPDGYGGGTGGEGGTGGGGTGGGGGSGGGDSGGGGGSGGETGPTPSITLTGVLTVDGVTTNVANETFTSATSDQNVILAKCAATLSVSNCTLIKTGDYSNEDQANFFAVNAVVTAQTNAMVYVENSTLFSDAKGANGLFASGTGSTIYAYGCTITNKSDSSRGLDATYLGTVIASKMTIVTEGDHCAAFATDRGNGYISATDSKMSTAGQGSPLIYSTGVIEVNSVTGTASGAQIAGIEGLSKIRIRNSSLTGSAEKASESIPNGVIIYQSGSGDYTEGTATFEVSDSALKSTVSDGAMFYATHTEAVITIQNTALDFDTEKNYLLKAAGNDGDNGWGDEGSNGAGVTLTAIDQTLKGDISVDGISSNDLYLVNSTYTGTIVNDTTYTGNGGANVFIDADSSWIVTSNCTLKCLTAADGATIRDASGNQVTIADSTGTLVPGTSAFTVTVSNYTVGDFVATNITDFSIIRTAFDAWSGSSGSVEDESGSGGSSGKGESEGTKTYYFKPHAPTNGVVGVSYNGTKIYPDMDHKYWLDAYWTNGVTVAVDYSADAGYVFADGSSETNLSLTITENRIDVYPPAGFETAYKAQAKRGATYYLTLKEAIESAKGGGKGGAKITLTDNVTLTETLTVTNSITLDLDGTNVITIGSALTPAFLFAADATISNGTITTANAADAEDCVLLRFTDCTATLSGVTLNGDCCLLDVDEDARVSLTNGCALACASAATVCCSSGGTLTIAADTSKSDGVVMVAPTGYHWENGELVSGTLESLAAGATSEAYDDAQTATNAAVAINANKADCIDVPTGVEDSAKTTYLTKVEATVTGDNRVVIDLTSAAEVEVQNAVDAAVTNETVFASLVSTNASATATISPTTPGLYYWIVGGTDVTAITNAGTGVLSTDGGAVELSKPTTDDQKNGAFYRFAAGVAAPNQSSAD